MISPSTPLQQVGEGSADAFEQQSNYEHIHKICDDSHAVDFMQQCGTDHC